MLKIIEVNVQHEYNKRINEIYSFQLFQNFGNRSGVKYFFKRKFSLVRVLLEGIKNTFKLYEFKLVSNAIYTNR